MSNDSLEDIQKESGEAQNLIADISALKAYEPTFDAHMRMLMEQVRSRAEA